MAINPPSDLVMDVARAADPQAYRFAAERLKSISANTGPAGADTDTGSNFVSFSESRLQAFGSIRKGRTRSIRLIGSLKLSCCNLSFSRCLQAIRQRPSARALQANTGNR